MLHAADDRAVAWHSAEALRRQLEQPVSISWSGVPLRRAVQNLARSQRVAILLDRRVDPDQEIELAATDIPLEEALSRIAAKLNLGVSRVGPVMYLGPAPTAERLRTLVELRQQEFNRLSPSARAPLVAPKPCQWDMLSTPRELLAEAASDYGVQIESLADVPHDLWPAGELPPVELAERVSLIVAQFDLTFQVSPDGRMVRLMPMPARAVLEKSYPVATPAAAISRLKDVLKSSELTASDRKIIVRGPAEEHEMVATLLSGKKVRRTTVAQGKTVYQLNIVMPVGRLLRELGPKLNLDIEIDEPAIQRAGLSLDKDVNVSVKDASEEQLLKAVLEPAGLTFQRAGRKLVVRPK
ncbi:MAG: STN domain-containing protein [Pirellulales bacterium]